MISMIYLIVLSVAVMKDRYSGRKLFSNKMTPVVTLDDLTALYQISDYLSRIPLNNRNEFPLISLVITFDMYK